MKTLEEIRNCPVEELLDEDIGHYYGSGLSEIVKRIIREILIIRHRTGVKD